MKFTLKTKWIAAIAAVLVVVLMTAHVHAGDAVYAGLPVTDPSAPLGSQANPYPTVEAAKAEVGSETTFIATSPVIAADGSTGQVQGQVAGAESFHFTLALRVGAHGDEVMQLQTRLNADGASPALVVDGKFGPKAAAALKVWQKAHGLGADGIVGPKTVATLNL